MINEAQNCKTVTCVSERRVNLSLHGVCGLGMFEETLATARDAPSILLHRSTGNFVVVKLQL